LKIHVIFVGRGAGKVEVTDQHPRIRDGANNRAKVVQEDINHGVIRGAVDVSNRKTIIGGGGL
jgi:hypothetical protein